MNVPPESSAPRKHQGCSNLMGGVILCSLLVFLAIAGVIPIFVIEAPFHLLFGWVAFLAGNFNDITFDVGRILAGVVGVSLAMAGLHLLAGGWRRASWPGSPEWKWRWSAAITGTLVAMAAAALSVAGVAHQIAWLKGEPIVEYGYGRFYLNTKQLNNARQAAFLLVDYTEAHDGKYPENLSAMVAWSVSGGSWNGDATGLLLYSIGQRSTPEPWLYFGRGLTTPVPDKTILLAAPRPHEGLRLVVTADTAAKAIAEEDFQNAISTQQSR